MIKCYFDRYSHYIPLRSFSWKAFSIQLHLVKGIQHRTFDALTVFHRRTFKSGPRWFLSKPSSRWFKVIAWFRYISIISSSSCILKINMHFIQCVPWVDASKYCMVSLGTNLESGQSWSKELHTGTNTCQHSASRPHPSPKFGQVIPKTSRRPMSSHE